MLSEKLKFCKALAPAADRFNTNPVTDWINTKNAARLTFLVIHQGGTTGVGTFVANASAVAAGSSPTAIPYTYRRMTTGDSDTVAAPAAATAAGIPSVAAEDTIIEIEIDVSTLPDGKPFVSLTCTETVNDPVNACVIAILDGTRYKSLTPPSAIVA